MRKEKCSIARVSDLLIKVRFHPSGKDFRSRSSAEDHLNYSVGLKGPQNRERLIKGVNLSLTRRKMAALSKTRLLRRASGACRVKVSMNQLSTL